MGAVLAAQALLRPMTAGDVAAVAALEADLVAFPWTPGNFSDSLAAGYGAWVAADGDALVGYAVMTLAADEAQLLVIGVAAGRQRSGLGVALLECLYEAARAAGAARMFLEVRPSNAAALALYRRQGFAEVGRRRGYYPAAAGREDAIVMEKAL